MVSTEEEKDRHAPKIANALNLMTGVICKARTVRDIVNEIKHYRIYRRKGRRIFGRENIKKSGCGLYDKREKKKKQTQVKTSTNLPIWDYTGKITIPLWYRTFPNILPTILSCIVDMKTKITS